jgi:DNA repair photolyase
MNYYQVRERVAEVIPRSKSLFDLQRKRRVGAVREKGRKSGYREYKLFQSEWVRQERLLNTEEVTSFLEVSCKASACPMPLNMDIWDGLVCPYNCCYCFANAFRASLYTAFFDNSRSMGIRHCNPKKYKRELDKLFNKYRGRDSHKIKNSVGKAIAIEIPMRFGIRFEDFLRQEERKGVSLEMLRYLASCEYPVMVNTKSALIGRDDYVEALAKNKIAAVHMTLISSDNEVLKLLEPAAPSYEKRLEAMKTLADAGLRVVARIEPWIPFVTDGPEATERYMDDLLSIGVKNLTFDTYSYSANNPGIAQAFRNAGLDWDRIFSIGCSSQGFGSILLGHYMKLWQDKGFSCSTFDMGNMPDNDQAICCEVGDLFDGFNYGCTVMAARFIISRKGKEVSWSDFQAHVNRHGGFLSDALETEVKELWNCMGCDAYSPIWSAGLKPVGEDKGNHVWVYNKSDFRQELLEDVLVR